VHDLSGDPFDLLEPAGMQPDAVERAREEARALADAQQALRQGAQRTGRFQVGA
jgi:hypothetical protein